MDFTKGFRLKYPPIYCELSPPEYGIFGVVVIRSTRFYGLLVPCEDERKILKLKNRDIMIEIAQPLIQLMPGFVSEYYNAYEADSDEFPELDLEEEFKFIRFEGCALEIVSSEINSISILVEKSRFCRYSLLPERAQISDYFDTLPSLH